MTRKNFSSHSVGETNFALSYSLSNSPQAKVAATAIAVMAVQLFDLSNEQKGTSGSEGHRFNKLLTSGLIIYSS